MIDFLGEVIDRAPWDNQSLRSQMIAGEQAKPAGAREGEGEGPVKMNLLV